MEIRAKVSQSIIKKADHFFTGSVGGRIVELMQNARRAGAKHVVVKQDLQYVTSNITGTLYQASDFQGVVTIHDDGEGIQNWDAILHLGESDWHHAIEDVEEPAGIGLFSLSPRPVTIRSQGRVVRIEGDGWFGAPLEVREDTSPERVETGTSLTFRDDSWADFEPGGGYQNIPKGGAPRAPRWPRVELRRAAAYGTMQVSFNGTACEQRAFIDPSWPSTHYPELGVRIAVMAHEKLPNFHDELFRRHVALNFYGQVIDDGLDSDLRAVPVYSWGGRGYSVYRDEYDVLVDMTGETTPLALMLPARTKLVEGPAYEQLKVACEREILRYYARKRTHNLEYKWFKRAHALGIEDFPEAEPMFSHGPNVGEMGNVEPWDGHRRVYGLDDNILIPEDVTVFLYEPREEGKCGDVFSTDDINTGSYCCDTDWRDAQLLSFIMGDPVDGEQQWMASVPAGYEGYSWAQGQDVADCLVVVPGRVVAESCFNDETAYVVDDITMLLGLRDGTIHQADVECCYGDNGDIYVTKNALLTSEWKIVKHAIWLTGGYSEDEPWELEDRRCDEEWAALRDELIGEKETLRRVIVEKVREQLPYDEKYATVIVTPKNTVVISTHDERTVIKADGSVKETKKRRRGNR